MIEKDIEMTPVPRFGFFEKVRVKAPDGAKSRLNGEVGAVLGRTITDDQKSWLYAVAIESQERTWSFFESELEPTGEYSDRSEFYDDTSLRVRVDEKGRGTVVPPVDDEEDQ